MQLDETICYRAMQTRDARFDGQFFTAVRTTGVYCRPICPAPAPRRENCTFYRSAAAAQEAGYRPCLRCRPEQAPDLLAALGPGGVVTRALRLIADGALDEGTVGALAQRLAVTERHLRRLCVEHLGAPPLTIALTRRILFAKQLLDETSLPMAEVALAAGFGSVRRFNTVLQDTYGRPPSALRRRGAEPAHRPGSAITLRLPFSPPYDWDALIGFLAARAIPGVEAVSPGAYRRTLELGGAPGVVEVRPVPGEPYLAATLWLPQIAALGSVVARLRRLFDLGANMEPIAAHLSRDQLLAPIVAARPGLRVPGAWDPFELAVRAILGQQVTVAGATTLAGRLAEAFGAPLDPGSWAAEAPGLRRLFPRPAVLAEADLTAIGLPRARARAISALAAAVALDRRLLEGSGGLADACARLCELPGIGPWTAQYIAMRALGEPDAFPATDLGLLRAMQRLGGPSAPAALSAHAESWRPWRSYAAMYLWQALGVVQRSVIADRAPVGATS